MTDQQDRRSAVHSDRRLISEAKIGKGSWVSVTLVVGLMIGAFNFGMLWQRVFYLETGLSRIVDGNEKIVAMINEMKLENARAAHAAKTNP